MQSREPTVELPEQFLDSVRNFKPSEANRQSYPDGWCVRGRGTDPKLIRLEPISHADWRIDKDSPAFGNGVALPTERHDPLRPIDGTKPDVGALPLGSEPFIAGRPSTVDRWPPASFAVRRHAVRNDVWRNLK